MSPEFIKAHIRERFGTLEKFAGHFEPPVTVQAVSATIRNGKSSRVAESIAELVGIPVAVLFPKKKRFQRENKNLARKRDSFS